MKDEPTEPGSRRRTPLRSVTARRPTQGAAANAEGAAAPGTTVGEQTYSRIRSDIVMGRLSPGRKLPLDRMRHTYGTSVSTLRELFSRLASEGLVVAEGARGFQVPTISSTNLREIASMRELLEGHGMRESFARGDIEWEGRVVAAHHMLASTESRMSAGEACPAETWRRYDWAFHLALVSACGSRVLLETYAGICDKFLRYQMIAAVFRGQVAADEHRVLLECALARDWQRAQHTLASHVQDCIGQMAAVIDATVTE